MSYQLYILMSIIGWGVGSFLYKGANTAMAPIMVSSVALVTYVIIMPILWLTVKFDHAVTIGGVLYTVVGSLFMSVGTLGFSYALRSGSAGSVTTLCALYPALTLGLSMLFLGETLTLRKGIGMVLALISFVVLSKS